MQRVESGTPLNFTDDGIVSVAAGILLGFYVNSTNAGTIVVYNGQDATSGTAITGTITPAIGFHRVGAHCPAGCFIAIGGTALDVTTFFVAG